MKKIFQVIGFISLTCFSFFMTEQTSLVVNSMDDIMISINDNKDGYKSIAKDAYIDEDTIIPGVCSKTVNVKKSYKNMKLNGYYNDKLYIYDYKKPKISLEDNINKYIIKGNPEKRFVSLIFVVEDNDDINGILNIINNYNAKVSFFVTKDYFKNNTEYVESIINQGHNIGIYTSDYTDSDIDLFEVIIKKIDKQKNIFCYNPDKNKDNLDICFSKGNYTIKPILISDTVPLLSVKENLESGNILSLKINSQLKKELSTMIIYIKSKGLKLTNLEDNVLE
ncbi:MAG: polysaccharide deacetylase family protein [bacterium]|nr:polysaccharide deacetylase family protein [bacterium]